jgi:drug/metabolite transporter (DMT)-like permease
MPTLSPATRGRLLIIAACLLWSTSGAFVKSPLLAAESPEVGGPMIAFYRAVAAVLILLPFVRLRRFRWHPVLIPMVISFAAMNILFISSMTLTTAANTILLQYSAPIWMFIASVTLLREPVDRRNVVGLILGMAGVAVILQAFWGGAEALGVLLGIGAGVAYAGVVVTLRVLRDHDPTVLTALNLGVSALVLLPWVAAAGIVPSLPQAGVLFAFGLVQVAAAYLVFTWGMKTVTPQEAGVITLLEPVLNPVWVLLLWGEPIAGATLIGGALILGGLAARYLPVFRS